MKVKGFIALAVILCIHSAVFAQPDTAISLPDAVSLAVKNSPALLASRAHIEEAVANYQAAKDRQLPDAKITGSYLWLGSANIDLKSAQNNNNGGSGRPSAHQAIYGIANVSLPLYAGGRIKYGIEAADLLKQAAEMAAQRETDNVTTRTVEAYTNLYKAGLTIDLLKKEIVSGILRDSNLSKLEQNGLLTRNDLLKSELQTSTLRLQLLEAESNRDLAGIILAILTGLPENSNLQATASFIPDLSITPDYASLVNAALNNRGDVKAGNIQAAAATYGIKSAKAEAYPSLALTGGYIAADIPKVLTISNAINIGIGIQYNLASLWKKNTALKQAQSKINLVQSMNQQLSESIRVQLNTTFQRYLLANRRITLYLQAQAQAEENRRIIKDKLDNNLVTLPELLEAEAAVLQASMNAQAARADAALAWYNLQLAAGNYTISNN
ncbi:MAG: TolC family protein [Ferruginibacter sp.]